MQPFTQKKLNNTAGILYGAIISVVFLAVASIAGELYAPFKTWLVSVFSHHWIGKGALAALIFLAASVFLRNRETNIARITNLTAALFWISLLSALAVAGFFGYEAFVK